jgi:hypothetical protein
VRAAVLLAVVAGLLLAPAAAAQQPEASRGVFRVAELSEPGVVSARAAGGLLYVSSVSGVSIYDISAPQAPVRVGRLDLPNAQNEDVDAGSGILLVSDDPYGGRGILHVVDVSDPAAPRVIGRYDTWARGLFDNFGDVRGLPKRRGIGHTATCLHDCRWAWLAGSAAGIEVVDLRDPANPRFAGRFRARAAAGIEGTHDVQVDGEGLAWVTGGRGTAAYDVTDPVNPVRVHRTSRAGMRGPLNDFIHHNAQRLDPEVVGVTEEDFGRRCRRAGSFQTWLIRPGRKMHPLDSWSVERDPGARVLCSAHYFDARDGIVAQGFYSQGVRLLDVRDPQHIRQLGWWIPRPGLMWGALWAPTDPAGGTVYALDHSRGIDVLSVDRAALRHGPRTPLPAAGRGPRDVALAIDDGTERARAGAQLEYGIAMFRVAGETGRATLRATVPPELVDVEPGSGLYWDPATRTLNATVDRLRRFRTFGFSARVAPGTPLRTPLEVIGYSSADGDVMPLDDRAVDRGVVARRTDGGMASLARAAPRRGYCLLGGPGPNYTS